jgi:hypothetical protein
MSDKTRGQQPPKPARLTSLAMRPSRDIEALAPPLANEVVVSGGADCVFLDFFYVPTERFVEMLDGGDNVERSVTSPGHSLRDTSHETSCF